MKKRKYRPGAKVTDVRLAVALIDGGEWLYMNHKPQHPGWMLGMTLATIKRFAEGGRLRIAIFVGDMK